MSELVSVDAEVFLPRAESGVYPDSSELTLFMKKLSAEHLQHMAESLRLTPEEREHEIRERALRKIREMRERRALDLLRKERCRHEELSADEFCHQESV